MKMAMLESTKLQFKKTNATAYTNNDLQTNKNVNPNLMGD